MRNSALKVGILLAGGVIIAALGCQTGAQRQTPGALPKSANASTPRLDASTYFAHGHLLERQGDFRGAVEQYERALQISPNFPSARNRLGITLNKLHRNVEATQQYRIALTQKPNDPQLLNNLGFSLFLCGDYAGAERTYRRTIEVAPGFTRAHMNLGLTLGKLNDLDGALQEFLGVCNESDAYYNLSVLQVDSGLYAEAAASLEHALQLNPKLEIAREQLREISRLAAIEEEKRTAARTTRATTPITGHAPTPITSPAVTTNDTTTTAGDSTPITAPITTPATTGTTTTAAPASDIGTLIVSTPETPYGATTANDIAPLPCEPEEITPTATDITAGETTGGILNSTPATDTTTQISDTTGPTQTASFAAPIVATIPDIADEIMTTAAGVISQEDAPCIEAPPITIEELSALLAANAETSAQATAPNKIENESALASQTTVTAAAKESRICERETIATEIDDASGTLIVEVDVDEADLTSSAPDAPTDLAGISELAAFLTSRTTIATGSTIQPPPIDDAFAPPILMQNYKPAAQLAIALEFNLKDEAACLVQTPPADVLKLCRLALEASLAGYASLRDTVLTQLEIQIERETDASATICE